MTTGSVEYKKPSLLGSFWGLAWVLILLVLTSVLPTESPQSKLATMSGKLALAAVYALPFVLTLMALRWGRPGRRFATLGAATLLAGFLSISSFSLTIVILPAAGLLFMATTRVANGLTNRQSTLAAVSTILLIALGVCAFFALFAVRDDGFCVEQTHAADGSVVTQITPYSDSHTLGGALGDDEVTCDSDAISTGEVLLSAAFLLLTVGVWVAIGLIERRLERPTANGGELTNATS